MLREIVFDVGLKLMLLSRMHFCELISELISACLSCITPLTSDVGIADILLPSMVKLFLVTLGRNVVKCCLVNVTECVFNVSLISWAALVSCLPCRSGNLQSSLINCFAEKFFDIVIIILQ